jgi:DNA-binding transcriptional LysR family regulator
MSNFSEVQSLRIFIAIVDAKGFAAAARFLGQTPSAISQRLSQLETRLGVKLLQRNSRKLQLTEEGQLLYERGRLLLGGLDELQRDLEHRRDSLAGPLKLWGPLAFGREYLAALLAEFHELHPGLDVSLTLSDKLSGFTKDRFDLVVHIGEMQAQDFATYEIAPNQRFLCASPNYLKNAPTLTHPNDLLRHKCLVLRENKEDSTLWHFRNGNEEAKVRVTPSLSSNDGEVIERWALADKGIFLRSEWAVAEMLKRGELVRVLPDWKLPEANVVAIVPHADGMPTRVRRFIEFLRGSFRPNPSWRELE